MKFHHIGIATEDINKAFDFVKDNFNIVKYSDIIYDQKQKAYLQMIYTKDVNIELVSGIVVDNLIKKK